MAGGVSIAGVAEFSRGIDAQGNRIKNARLENVTFEGVVGGDVVELAGGVRVGALKNAGGGGVVVVAAAESGELKVAAGLSFDDENGVFMPGKVSGHEVSESVIFMGLFDVDHFFYRQRFVVWKMKNDVDDVSKKNRIGFLGFTRCQQIGTLYGMTGVTDRRTDRSGSNASESTTITDIPLSVQVSQRHSYAIFSNKNEFS